jgi:hypothetical protein
MVTSPLVSCTAKFELQVWHSKHAGRRKNGEKEALKPANYGSGETKSARWHNYPLEAGQDVLLPIQRDWKRKAHTFVANREKGHASH